MENNNDKIQLSQWVMLYTKDLYFWALNRTSNHTLAEDLVQETFLAAAENIDSFKSNSQPKTWLFGILKNKIADHYRKMMTQQTVTFSSLEGRSAFFQTDGQWQIPDRPQHWQDAEEHLTNIPTFNKIWDYCIEELPPMMNSCIRLKLLDDKKGEEICQDLGLSATNYWQIIHRAKLKLRKCLEVYWFKKA